jgi:hypothetical protein
MKYTTILFTVLMLASFACASTLVAKDTTGTQGTRATVSLYVSGATKLGAMDIKVQYDPKVLQFKEASLGDVSSNGLIEARDSGSGTVMISFADTKGISFDGELISLAFDVVGKAGSSTQISLDAKAYGTDLLDMPLDVKAGSVRVVSGASVSTTLAENKQTGGDNMLIYIILGVVVLIILAGLAVIGVGLLMKSKKKK